jgi:catechol 2,3-dioxygenase-like lactoylglutathione lyase family enzyme
MTDIRVAISLLLSVAMALSDAEATRDHAIYGHVSHLGWVVRDLDATVAAWRAIGVTDVRDGGVSEFSGVYRGRPVQVRVKKAIAWFGNGVVQWIQPLGPGSPYADFLAAHGEGVQHVAYSVPSLARLDEEVAGLKAMGVDTLASGSWRGRAGAGRFVDLDTSARGAVTLELERDPDADAPSATPSSNEDPFTKITQYAFVVRDVHAVSDYYAQLGLGALPIERNVSLNRVYRGKPGVFEMLLGWGRQGDVVFEWIQSTAGPNVYDEYLAQHGEGLHHLGFNVPDMDATLAALTARGLAVTMSGGWNVNGSEGRFAYLDTEKHGGVTVELLWNKPRN